MEEEKKSNDLLTEINQQNQNKKENLINNNISQNLKDRALNEQNDYFNNRIEQSKDLSKKTEKTKKRKIA